MLQIKAFISHSHYSSCGCYHHLAICKNHEDGGLMVLVCGALLLTSWKNPFVALLVGPEILPELYSLHFQLPHTWRGCCWLTDWLTLRAIQRDKWHVRCVLCIPMRPSTLPQSPTYVSFSSSRVCRPILILIIICWYPSTQINVSKFNRFPISHMDRETLLSPSLSARQRNLVPLLELAKVHLEKCRRRVLHLNEPVVVLLLTRAVVRCWCRPVEWQEENLEIMLFGFAENLHPTFFDIVKT